MAWSYSGDPSDSELDEVRYLVQDTDSSNQLVQNEEIEYELTQHPTVIATAVSVATAIYGKLTLTETLSVRLAYGQLVGELKIRLAQGAVPHVGGTSISEKDNQKEDSDRVRPAFVVYDDPYRVDERDGDL